MSFTSNCVCSNEKTILVGWQFQKNALLDKKKTIRKTFWKKGGYWTALKSFSLAQSISTGNSKSFFV